MVRLGKMLLRSYEKQSFECGILKLSFVLAILKCQKV
jgi:hypothetical protein